MGHSGATVEDWIFFIIVMALTIPGLIALFAFIAQTPY